MRDFMLCCKWQLGFCVCLLLFGQPSCFAQSSNPSPGQQASAADQPVPPAIQKELDAMKKRIDALEAELKNRTAQGQTAESATKALSTTSESAANSLRALRGEGASGTNDDSGSEAATVAPLTS